MEAYKLEEGTHYTTAAERVSSSLRIRPAPDVPQDIIDDEIQAKFIQDHLNDPNFDLRKNYPPSFVSDSEHGPTPPYEHESKKIDFSDADSHYSTSRAESRVSTAIEFDE